MKRTTINVIAGFVLLLCCGSNPARAMTTDEKVDSLFIIASSGELKYRDEVDPAIDSLAAMGKAAVPRLIEKYTTQDARERLTINNILVKVGSAAVPLLRSSLDLNNAEQVGRICYTLGEIGDSSAVGDLIGVAFHSDWRVRSECAGALGKIGDHRADYSVEVLLGDEDETVRKSAAVAAGKLHLEEAIPVLVHMLGDEFYGARLTAAEALVKMGAQSIQPVIDSMDSENRLVGDVGCSVLGSIGGDIAALGVGPQLDSDSALRRALAVEAIYDSNSSLACGLVELLRETETDPIVLYFIDRTLGKYASR